MRNPIRAPVKPRDFLAPALVWALALAGCVIGDVKPAHDRSLVACAR
jgi:hypothetical protein